ncbi:MAG: hypothetical protein ACJARK_000412 [Marinobacter psychrophilus]|jgi:hypothetical protein|uniref:beta strand repeat-containing protein n=1 Tax=Marinobacter psychrophilus TaxID=330734 RepID=UPI0039E4F23A
MQSAPIFCNTTVIRCVLMRSVVMLSLLLTTFPALAADYLFSATSTSFPTSCAYVSVGNYQCANLSLLAGDTVTMDPIAPVTPATINVVGTVVITGATVNVGGLAADLNIVAVGTVTIGTATLTINTQVNANVSSIAAVGVHPGSVIGGNLSASTIAGIITVGANVSVVGDVYTDEGAISIGIGSDVGGNVFSTGAGVITVGATVTVAGNVSTDAGAISIGIGSNVGGTVFSTGAGAITVGADVIVAGGVQSVAGGITIGDRSDVGGEVFSTGAGVITVGADASVGGSLSTFDGAINVGIGAQIGGGVSSSGQGVITLAASVTVVLDVISAVGAVTVGDGSSIGGDVGSTAIETATTISSGAGVVTLGANITVGGNVFSIAGAIDIGDATTVVGNVSSSGAGVLTLTTNVVVGGSVTSTVGAVDVGGSSTVCGDVGTIGAGVITLTTDVSVGGGVYSIAGAITIGAGSTVQLSVDITGAGVMTLTGVEVGGDIYTAVGAITGTSSLVRGHITASGIHEERSWSHQTNLVVSEPAACTLLFPPQSPPDILILKSVQVYSDPANLQDNPKAIPGSVMFYTVMVTNRGGSTDTDTVVITDPMPVNTEVFVNDINGAGSGPLLFTDGNSVSGLSYSMNSLASTTDNISFSNDNGASFGYTPIPNVDGYDIAVTDIKVSLSGPFNASSGAPHPSFSIIFRVRVQ